MDRWREMAAVVGMMLTLLPVMAAAADQEMEVLGLQVDPRTRATTVLLRSRDKREMTIYVGAVEAQAIAAPLQNAKPERPATHDLFLETIHRLDGRVKRALIRDIQENTFLADLVIEVHGREIPLDARPSDAIALALREGAPIFATDRALQTTARPEAAP